MTEEEIIRRVTNKIKTDKGFANNIAEALETQDDNWLMGLLRTIGIIIQIGTAIWNSIVNWFNE
jgi:hypothetical protein